MSQESAIYTLKQDDKHQVLPTLQEKCSHFQTAVPLSVSLAIKVSATLQDSPRADRFRVSCFYKNPYKPYIF